MILSWECGTVFTRSLEKSREERNKDATRAMDCHFGCLIYSLMTFCLHLLNSLYKREQWSCRVPE